MIRPGSPDADARPGRGALRPPPRSRRNRPPENRAGAGSTLYPGAGRRPTLAGPRTGGIVSDSLLSRNAGGLALAAGAAFAARRPRPVGVRSPRRQARDDGRPLVPGVQRRVLRRLRGPGRRAGRPARAAGRADRAVRPRRLPRRAGRHHDPGRQHVVRRVRGAVAGRGGPAGVRRREDDHLAGRGAGRVPAVRAGLDAVRDRGAAGPGGARGDPGGAGPRRACSATSPGCRPTACRSAWPWPRWGSG